MQADPGPDEEPTEAYVAIMASLEQDHPTIQLPPSIIAADKADKVLLLHANTTGKLPRCVFVSVCVELSGWVLCVQLWKNTEFDPAHFVLF